MRYAQATLRQRGIVIDRHYNVTNRLFAMKYPWAAAAAVPHTHTDTIIQYTVTLSCIAPR